MKRQTLWLLGAIGITAIGVLLLSAAYPGSLGTRDAQVQLAYGLVLLAMVSSSVAIASRAHLKSVVKSALIWIAIGLGLITVYIYKDGFETLAANMLYTIDPSQPRSAHGEVTIRENADGHFTASAVVEGARVRFLVDTGASEVVLTRADARRVGIDVDNLSYSAAVSTANGVTMVAPIRLHSIRLGTIEVNGVNAAVAGDGLDFSLLGMSYLRRLSSWQVSNRTLILKE
jgi:aspartyl protease family protein